MSGIDLPPSAWRFPRGVFLRASSNRRSATVNGNVRVDRVDVDAEASISLSGSATVNFNSQILCEPEN